MMKTIVMFGAGKSATCLIKYLLKQLELFKWNLLLVDSDLSLAQSKIEGSSRASALAIDVSNHEQREKAVSSADIIISLLPPALHILIAQDCLKYRKNLLTASYVDNAIRALESEINTKEVLFLCEMGLDPGIDHMSAMKIIDEIHQKGGKITSFKSHCGGLVAPESDDNPWHYKISWNPRNVVMAGKSGAVYLEEEQVKKVRYEELFNRNNSIEVGGLGTLCYYPNRDSLEYVQLYSLQSAKTFVRTTLRYPEFMSGWKNIVDLKLTDETLEYDTDGMTLQRFFQQHLQNSGFSEWLIEQLGTRLERPRDLPGQPNERITAEEERAAFNENLDPDFVVVNREGELGELNLDLVKTRTADTVASQMHEANTAMKQLIYLGLNDDETIINRGKCSAADVLQFALEKKLVLNDSDKDMIVMVHEIEYSLGAKNYKHESCLIVRGKDRLETAMAQTVGLPLGIAAKMILLGQIKLKGLHVPVVKEIYQPVLVELREHGISFSEKEMEA